MKNAPRIYSESASGFKEIQAAENIKNTKEDMNAKVLGFRKINPESIRNYIISGKYCINLIGEINPESMRYPGSTI